MTDCEEKINENETDDNEGDIDYVLSDVGEFGKHQIIHFILMILPIVLASTYAVEFIVTSSTVDYRCMIPGCDKNNDITRFNQPWVRNAVPFKNDRPEKCSRYNDSHELIIASDLCSSSLFNHSIIVQCTDYIFKTNEHRIIKECEASFGIYCDDNEYKLALVGTINNIGGFLFMPLTGLLSDKYGRLTVLIFGMLGSATCGLIKACVSSYNWYMIFEFLGSAAGTCTYMAAFVLCIEWVSSKHRILSSTIIAIIYPLGEILLGVSAILFEHYRTFLLAIYAPGLLIIFYFWLVPESVRWLSVTGQHKRALKILNNTAKQNKRKMSNRSIQILKKSCNETKNSGECDSDCAKVFSIFKHKILIVRLLTCSLCWIIVTHLFYGLSVNATKIANDDNKYLSYITTMIAEVPAAIITYFILNYVGRRGAVSGSMLVAGIATILSTVVPTHHTILIRVIFFTGMCCTSTAFAVLYIMSAEIWPTSMRNTLMNLCSMIGRFGSMLAPLTTLLAQYMVALPLLIFGGTSILCGFIIFLLPETRNKKLPDTVDEARKL